MPASAVEDMIADENDLASVVSIEVDGRQAYLLETDKWREMLGASRIIDSTVDEARRRFVCRDAQDRDGLFLFGPVSGEIRAWAYRANREKLLKETWALRRFLAERGVEHTCAYLECSTKHFLTEKTDDEEAAEDTAATDDDGLRPEPRWPSLAWVHGELSQRIKARKTAKDQPDARPVCSLFAPCRLHGLDFANEWTPGDAGDDEPRRELRSHRAGYKFRAWMKDRDAFLRERLEKPLAKKLKDALGVNEYVLPNNITFRDLADQLDNSKEPGGDQYVGFLKADGDGFGDLFTYLDWNTNWGERAPRTPWERNAKFATDLKKIVDDAFTAGLVAVTVPNREAAVEIAARFATDTKVTLPLPVLPQLFGGDDMWTLARREVALTLATTFSEEFAKAARDDNFLKIGLNIVNEKGAKRMTTWRPFAFSISVGVAFAKAAYPAHAMHDAAEWLLSEAKKHRKAAAESGAVEAYLDWHWIQSSLNEEVETARRQGFSYRDGDIVCELTTLPWSLGQAKAFLSAEATFAKIARRKREQLTAVLWRGAELSNLAWEAWWSGLSGDERTQMTEVAMQLRGVGVDLITANQPTWSVSAFLPWLNRGPRKKATPLLDLVGLHDVLDRKKTQTEATMANGGEGESADA